MESKGGRKMVQLGLKASTDKKIESRLRYQPSVFEFYTIVSFW